MSPVWAYFRKLHRRFRPRDESGQERHAACVAETASLYTHNGTKALIRHLHKASYYIIHPSRFARNASYERSCFWRITTYTPKKLVLVAVVHHISWATARAGPSKHVGGLPHGGRRSSSSSGTHLMGSGPGRPVKTHGPPHGPGGAAHIDPTCHGPWTGPAHQISSIFQRTGRVPTRHHIFKFSRPGPAQPINFSNVSARPGPAQTKQALEFSLYFLLFFPLTSLLKKCPIHWQPWAAPSASSVVVTNSSEAVLAVPSTCQTSAQPCYCCSYLLLAFGYICTQQHSRRYDKTKQGFL